MAHLPIQCQNCGAKYKIPETFPGDFAKCKACSTKIDVQAARGEQSAPAAPAARDSTKRTTGGTRKPRQAAEAKAGSRQKRGEDDAPAKKGRRTAGASRRQKKHADEDGGDDAGRRGYERKKDNTPLILGGSLAVLAIIVVTVFMFWGGGEDPATTNTDPKKIAAKNTEKQPEQEPEETPEEAAAAKKAAEEEAAKAKAKAAAAKAKKKPKPVIKKDSEVLTAADIFKPSTLSKLPHHEGTSEEDVTTISEQLDYLKEGGGLSFIRAPAKLRDIGAKMIPLAVNRLMTLDYSDAEQNQYAFAISEAIKGLTEFELAFDPARIVSEFTLKQGHANAKKVKDLHTLTRTRWQSDDKVKADIARREKN